jgi:hypothetical protein
MRRTANTPKCGTDLAVGPGDLADQAKYQQRPINVLQKNCGGKKKSRRIEVVK